ncbi:MAG: N-formylglutamate amidohydrolase, partial [Pseudomonadota bacterium]
TLGPRVASGLGVVPRVVANGRSIYRGKMSLKEAEDRIKEYWTPWHDALTALMDDSEALFDEAILIDCHSMPHEALESVNHSRSAWPDVVLGDRFGAAASSDIVDKIEAAITSAGLKVARNAPFAGAFVTQSHGRPARNRHVIQVEIDRSLYMNEQQIRPNNNFAAFKALIDRVVADVTDIGRADIPMAAE